ncbi:MAG TPA: MFS transporter [Candidatus Krumholzibacteria bacterium]|nr:MFS transporter [Candidatus Krumholzibacteria bacterium]
MSTNIDRNERMTPFLILWTGQALSLLGSTAVQFALIWWLTQQTGSATVLAMAALLGLLPTVALGPVIGVLVDRWDRKRVMLASDAMVALASLVLACLYFADTATTGIVFVILFLRGLGAAFYSPAMLASTSLMVSGEHLTRIQGLNQMLQGGITIVSAPLGALLLAALPMSGVMLVDVVTALFAIVPLVFIHVPRPRRAGEAALKVASSIWSEMIAGVRYLAERKGHVSLVVMAALINACLVPAFSLLPLLVSGELRGDALQLAWVTTAFGVGTIAGGILLGLWRGTCSRILIVLPALVGLGVGVIAVGIAPAYVPALAAMLLIGLIVPFVNGPIQAILQATIAAEYQGRVFTLVGSLAGVTAPLGLILAAPVAEMAGVRAWYVAGGLVCVAMGAAGYLVPSLLRIETPPGDSAAHDVVDERATAGENSISTGSSDA